MPEIDLFGTLPSTSAASMFWVVQTNLFQSNRRQDLLQTLARFDIPHVEVKLTANGLSPEVDHDGPIITNGSIELSNLARERGWSPGGFVNDNFRHVIWADAYSEFCLNRLVQYSDLEHAIPHWDRCFVRPISDQKTFSGTVVATDGFQAWKQRMLDQGIPADTPIVCSPANPAIGQEHRHFIVDGRVVSSSRYKLGGMVNESPDVDSAVVAFAQRVAAIWSPTRAFVLDTYQTGDRIGVVEMGGICHAGFYRANVQAIVLALDSMESYSETV